MGDVLVSLTALENSLADIAEKIKNWLPVDRTAHAKLEQEFIAVDRAVAAMTAHLANLQRRENTPTVTDKLRNLKNVFKDKATLSKSRKDTADYFASIKGELDAVKGSALDTLNKLIYYETVRENVVANNLQSKVKV